MTRAVSIPAASIDQNLADRMWTLFDRHYTGISKPVFLDDLEKKEQAIVLYFDEKLIGFCSIGSVCIDRQLIAYSGDTIVAQEHRDMGTIHLFHSWAKYVWERFEWWCFLSSGPRTYRIPHTFFKRVTPNPDNDERLEEKNLRNRIAAKIYQDHYNMDTGLVRLNHPYTLRDPFSGMRSDYPYYEFFQSRNPSWQKGDELVSLICLAPQNWKPVARRMLNWNQNEI